MASDVSALLASLGAMLVTHMGVFHDAAGKLVPQSEWTPEMWACVRRVKYGEDGNVEWLEMFDRLSVLTILLRAAAASGKAADGKGTDLADILGEFDVSRVQAPPVVMPAGGKPVDVEVAPEPPKPQVALSARAARRAANKAAWANSPENANNRRRKGGG